MNIDKRLSASVRKHGGRKRTAVFGMSDPVVGEVAAILEGKGLKVSFAYGGGRDNETLFGTNAMVVFTPESFERYMSANAERMKTFLRETDMVSLVVSYYGRRSNLPIIAQPTLVFVLPSQIVWKKMTDEQYGVAVQSVMRRCEEDVRRHL